MPAASMPKPNLLLKRNRMWAVAPAVLLAVLAFAARQIYHASHQGRLNHDVRAPIKEQNSVRVVHDAGSTRTKQSTFFEANADDAQALIDRGARVDQRDA